jgi:alpha-tubulin suppressor-like RCC1 family protein
MRAALLSPLLLFACSGDGGGGTLDAGLDAGSQPDVTPEYYVEETAPPTPTLVDVTAGAQHTCALVAYGGQYVTYCFGADAALGAPKQGILAVTASGTGSSPNFLSITSSHGAGHTCAIDTQKQVWCWGDDTHAQCGQGQLGNNVASPLVALDSQIGYVTATTVAVGSTSTCVLRSKTGKLACFGENGSCQTDLWDSGGCLAGAMTAVDTTDVGVVFDTVTTLSVGAVHGCVAATPLPSGNPGLFCFGDNASLESGPSGKTITTPAAAIASPQKVASIATGDAHTCFVTDSPHQLYCFGKNDVHQASPTSATSPIDPTAMTPIALPQSAVPNVVVARSSETCVVDIDGLLWCFGQSHGSNIEQVTGVKDVGKIAMGGAHTCVIGHLPSDSQSAPGSLLCWGDNTDGQAGQTAGGTVAAPTAVAIPATAPVQ